MWKNRIRHSRGIRMKPLACEVNWYEGYANKPELRITVDEFPNKEDLRYEEKDHCFFAEKNGYISFFYWEKPERGYGGREFPITMKDKTLKVLTGPWSSRASVMCEHFQPCLDVAIRENYSVFFSGHVTLEFAQEAINLCEEKIELIELEERGETIWVPQRKV